MLGEYTWFHCLQIITDYVTRICSSHGGSAERWCGSGDVSQVNYVDVVMHDQLGKYKSITI